MEKFPQIEKIEAEKAFMKDATALLESDADKKYFKNKKKAFQAARALADTEEQFELLLNNYVQARHQITFLLYRKGLITENLSNRFLAMEPIEDANKRYADIEQQRKNRQDEEQKRINELKDEEDKLDIFKAVLSGMSQEKAEEELKKYQEQVANIVKQQG